MVKIETLSTRMVTSVGGEGLRLVRQPRHDCRHISNNTTGTVETSKMASFRDVQTAPLDSYMDGVIKDDEFLLPYEAYNSRNRRSFRMRITEGVIDAYCDDQQHFDQNKTD